MQRYTALAVTFALTACAQNAAAPASSVNAVPEQDWVARAAATVRVSNDPYDLRDCEFVTVLSIPGGWDGKLESMSPSEESALNEMKVETVRAGGNFVLLYPGPEPSAEGYLCTE